MTESKTDSKKASKQVKEPKAEGNNTVDASTRYLAAVRLRGGRRFHVTVKRTLEQLNLRNQHNCVILENRPNFVGMLKKVKDYVTYGTISKQFKDEIENKKVEKLGDGTTRKFLRLNPPKGGFERKGIKVDYAQGGALGFRGEAIVDLLKRMM